MTPVIGALIAGIVAAVTGLIGALVGHRIAGKRAATEWQAMMATVQKDLVDQLQEERNHLDQKLVEQQRIHNEKSERQEARHSDDVDKLNRRITGFYADKHASRRYIAALEDHINQRNPPPPPEPPPGYVP